jgi:hypothetical protein
VDAGQPAGDADRPGLLEALARGDDQRQVLALRVIESLLDQAADVEQPLVEPAVRDQRAGVGRYDAYGRAGPPLLETDPLTAGSGPDLDRR